MLDRSKGKGQTKCSSWFSRLGARHGAYKPTLEEFTVTKPPEHMEEAKDTQGCSASKEEKM
jgi:hypothetical protein